MAKSKSYAVVSLNVTVKIEPTWAEQESMSNVRRKCVEQASSKLADFFIKAGNDKDIKFDDIDGIKLVVLEVDPDKQP